MPREAKTRASWPDILVLMGLAVVALWTAHGFLRPGLFPGGHDQVAHMMRLAAFDVALRDGQWPPLWAGDFQYGYGAPVFAFYPSLLYYLTEPWVLLGADVLTAWRITLVLCTVLTAWLMYGWTRGWWGRAGAAVAGVAVTLVPYHLLDLYVRAAYTEYAAFPLTIGMLWAGDRYMQRGTRGAWFALVGTTAALVGMHFGSIVIMGPLVAVWIALGTLGSVRQSWRRMATALAGLAVALLLTVGDWLPLLLEQSYLNISTETRSGYFTYDDHFLTLRELMEPTWGFGISRPDDTEHTSFQLGLVHWAGLACGLICLPWRQRRVETGGLLLLAGLSLVMTLPASRLIWDRSGVLQALQFPWRFLLPAAVASSALMGRPLLTLRGRTGWQVAAAVCLVGLLIRTYGPYRVSGFHDLPVPRSARELLTSLRATGLGRPEYLPRDLPSPPVRVPPQSVLAPPQAEVTVQRDLGHDVLFVVRTPRPVAVSIERFALPGWRVVLDGHSVPLEPDPVRGTIQIAVPRGEHTVRVSFGLTPGRLAALGATGLVALSLGALWWRWGRGAGPVVDCNHPG